MTSRRQFLAASTATAGALTAVRGWAAKTSPTGFPYTEFEARIARRDFRDMTKDVLPTPCMVVDQAMFERNVKLMAERTKTNGIAVPQPGRFTRAWISPKSKKHTGES